MVINYNIFNTSIGRVTIEPNLKNATVFGGAITILDYMEKSEVTEILRKNLSVQKRGGKFPLADVATALIIGRLLGIERVYHFEGIENETLLKRFFGWDKLPDYTTYYNDLQRFENEKDIDGLQMTNEQLAKRILSKQNRVILDFDSSVNTVYGKQEGAEVGYNPRDPGKKNRKSTRLNSSHVAISYAVFCSKKKITIPKTKWRSTGRSGSWRKILCL